MIKNETKKHKTLGQVYTPLWIVNEILDYIGYNNSSILDKYIIEPSCGDGVFLEEIIKRYIKYSKIDGNTNEVIVNNLQQYIYGIELDDIAYNKTIIRLNKIVNAEIGEFYVRWNILNENTLKIYKNYTSFFDYVVGNPPYIRIHNIDDDTLTLLKNNFIFTDGSLDLYISFFELGIDMLKYNGKLGYITPNSYLRNTSYKKFRKYLKDNKLIELMVDFKENQIFDNYSTYTAITILCKNTDRNNFSYKEFIDGKIVDVNKIHYNTLTTINWSFSNKENTYFMDNMNDGKTSSISEFFDVQYGFATLRDKLFISSIGNFSDNNDLVYFNDVLIERSILKKIIKASKYKGDIDNTDYTIFPYTKIGGRYKVINEAELKCIYPLTYKYLLSIKDELLKRDIDKNAVWYEYGRSQGVQSMDNEKIVVSTMVKDEVNFYRLPSDVFMYSGIFIVKKNNSDWDIVEKVLKSEEFIKYIKITGKDLSGGYKSLTSKHIKEFKIN